jgi:hypothetical protein
LAFKGTAGAPQGSISRADFRIRAAEALMQAQGMAQRALLRARLNMQRFCLPGGAFACRTKRKQSGYDCFKKRKQRGRFGTRCISRSKTRQSFCKTNPRSAARSRGPRLWSAAIRKRRSRPDCRAAKVRLLPRQAGAAATWRNEPEIGTQEGRRHFWQNEPKAAVAVGARHASPLRARGGHLAERP